jgi:hypothetical protein
MPPSTVPPSEQLTAEHPAAEHAANRSTFRRMTSGRSRWWLQGTAAVLIGGVAFVVTPKPYNARASVLLLPPGGGNPYLDDNPSLESTVNVLLLKAKATPAELGPTTRFTLALDDSINEPIVLMTTTDTNATRARAALTELEKYTASTLSGIQDAAGARGSNTISLQVLTQTPQAQITRYQAIQRWVLGTPIAFLIFLALGVLSDQRRRSRVIDPDTSVPNTAEELV